MIRIGETPTSVSDAKRRAVVRSHFTPVAEARGRDIGVTETFLDLDDVRLVGERVRRCGGAERMHAEDVHSSGDTGLKAIFPALMAYRAAAGSSTRKPVKYRR